MRLKAYYQNVRGLRTKTSDFKISVLSNDYDLIMLSETWLHEHLFDSELFDNRYLVYRNDRDSVITEKSRGGGCLIAVKRNICSRRITDFEVGQGDLWVVIDHTDGYKTFFNVKYIDYDSKLPTYESHFHKLNDILNEKEPRSSFFLCGDYNLKSSITWVRRNQIDSVCIATNLEGDIARAMVDVQSLTSLEL